MSHYVANDFLDERPARLRWRESHLGERGGNSSGFARWNVEIFDASLYRLQNRVIRGTTNVADGARRQQLTAKALRKPALFDRFQSRVVFAL